MAGSGNGTFDEGIRHLMNDVGYGDITAGVYVDQHYAQDQHESLNRKHSAGRAKYLSAPLMEDAFESVSEIARRVITETGSDLHDAMKDQADKMADYVATNAPTGGGKTHLRTSPSPYVVDDEFETYRRPPITPRDENEHY